MKIAVGADHAGFEAKEEAKKLLTKLGHEVLDMGAGDSQSSDYPDYAHKVGRAVARREADLGILMCGTGIGVCIAANKVRGVRAALAYSVEAARLSRMHNDANVLCLGGRTMSTDERARMIEAWLSASFEGGRHERRVNKIEEV